MSCVITYTSSTANQDFTDAIAKFPDLSDVRCGLAFNIYCHMENVFFRGGVMDGFGNM